MGEPISLKICPFSIKNSELSLSLESMLNASFIRFKASLFDISYVYLFFINESMQYAFV